MLNNAMKFFTNRNKGMSIETKDVFRKNVDSKKYIPIIPAK